MKKHISIKDVKVSIETFVSCEKKETKILFLEDFVCGEFKSIPGDTEITKHTASLFDFFNNNYDNNRRRLQRITKRFDECIEFLKYALKDNVFKVYADWIFSDWRHYAWCNKENIEFLLAYVCLTKKLNPSQFICFIETKTVGLLPVDLKFSIDGDFQNIDHLILNPVAARLYPDKSTNKSAYLVKDISANINSIVIALSVYDRCVEKIAEMYRRAGFSLSADHVFDFMSKDYQGESLVAKTLIEKEVDYNLVLDLLSSGEKIVFAKKIFGFSRKEFKERLNESVNYDSIVNFCLKTLFDSGCISNEVFLDRIANNHLDVSITIPSKLNLSKALSKYVHSRDQDMLAKLFGDSYFTNEVFYKTWRYLDLETKKKIAPYVCSRNIKNALNDALFNYNHASKKKPAPLIRKNITHFFKLGVEISLSDMKGLLLSIDRFSDSIVLTPAGKIFVDPDVIEDLTQNQRKEILEIFKKDN